MRKSSHQGKTMRQREVYNKTIKQLNLEPTIDESIKFPSSDDGKQDLSVDTLPLSRPPKLSERVGDHLKEKWVAYTIGAIAAFSTFFIFNFNRDMGKVEGKLDVIQDVIKKDLGEVKSDIKRLDAKIQSQDLQMQRNEINIDNMSHNKRR